MFDVFDVFDILVPELATTEIELHETAFGPDDVKFAYVRGEKFAKVQLARDAYTELSPWTGSEARGSWTVLAAHAEAREASAHDVSWARFLDALVVVLKAHDFWRVTCESDCDQHPIETLIMSPDDLSAVLDSIRSTGALPIALRVTPRAEPADASV